MPRHAHCPGPEGVSSDFVMAHRVLGHAEPRAAAVPGACGICGAPVWLLPRTRLFLRLRQRVPLLCCLCGTSRALLHSFAGGEYRRVDVPDLADASRWN
jgi:hypothetical protein